MGKKSREKRERKESPDDLSKEREYHKTGLEKTCLFIIRWGVYLSLFTPMIVSTDFFFPFVAPKTIFFRILIEIILGAYILLAIMNRRYRPKINSLLIALFIFLLIFILTSFTGVNLSRSFWSTYERMTGIWTMLHLCAFFVILTSVFKKKEDWAKIIGVSVIVGVSISLYILGGDKLSSRGGGTIGNTSFMAAYLLFDIFFAIILLLSKKMSWQIFAGGSLLIMLPVLFTSTARGAIIAFILGIVLMALGYMFFSKKKILKRISITIPSVVILAAIILVVWQPPFIESGVNNLLLEMKPRFAVWGTAWQGFLEKPVLGWGPENFNNVFLKNFNPCMFMSECGGEIWFDRAHNIVLDILVTSGVVGLLGYLAIFAVAIFGLWKAALNVKEKKELFIPLGLMAILAIYFFQNLLVFDMISSYLVFFLTLSFAGFLVQKKEEENYPVNRKINPISAMLTIFLIAGALFFGNIEPLIANHNIIRVVSTNNAEDAMRYFEKSLGSLMDKYETREQFTQKVLELDVYTVEEEYKDDFASLFSLAEDEMKKSVEENSLDFRPRLFLGQLYNHSYRLALDSQKALNGVRILEEAINLSPTNQQGYWNLADIKISTGNKEESISLLETAVDLEPRMGRSYWYLSNAYRVAGDEEKALENIILAGENGYNWWNYSFDLQKVVNLLSSLNIDIYDYFSDIDDQLVGGFLSMTEEEPENQTAWMYLAAGYANLGQFDKAREAAQKVIEINPDTASQAEVFLESLPQ
jgi:O-antigen ligase